jgi:hypothetical protein
MHNRFYSIFRCFYRIQILFSGRPRGPKTRRRRGHRYDIFDDDSVEPEKAEHAVQSSSDSKSESSEAGTSDSSESDSSESETSDVEPQRKKQKGNFVLIRFN